MEHTKLHACVLVHCVVALRYRTGAEWAVGKGTGGGGVVEREPGLGSAALHLPVQGPKLCVGEWVSGRGGADG